MNGLFNIHLILLFPAAICLLLKVDNIQASHESNDLKTCELNVVVIEKINSQAVQIQHEKIENYKKR